MGRKRGDIMNKDLEHKIYATAKEELEKAIQNGKVADAPATVDAISKAIVSAFQVYSEK